MGCQFSRAIDRILGNQLNAIVPWSVRIKVKWQVCSSCVEYPLKVHCILEYRTVENCSSNSRIGAVYQSRILSHREVCDFSNRITVCIQC